jgi:hypothetical protein
VPQEIWYDNLKSAVNKVLRGSTREEQDSFVSFRTHYLFRAEFCNVRSGWEKGGVEGRVGYGRRNWLIGEGEFESWQALNQYLADRCRQNLQRRLRGRIETIGERLQAEQTHFLPLPDQPYPCCHTQSVRANTLALVTFATNRYSVPVAYTAEPLILRAYVDRIELSAGAQVIAVHARCWGREQDILNPYHYLSLLARRPRAFHHAQAIRAWRPQWPPVFEHYFAELRQRHETSQATRLFIEILQLGQTCSEAVLAAALEEALQRRCLAVADVRELVRRRLEPSPPPPAALAEHPHLAAIQVALPDLPQFDQLLSQLGGVGA